MKKVSILLIATLLVGAFSASAFASGFVGLGIGLQPTVTNSQHFPGTIMILNIGAGYDINDKFTVDANIFGRYYQKKRDNGDKDGDALLGIHVLVGGKYNAFKLGPVTIGPELDLMYTNNFMPILSGSGADKYLQYFAVRAGIFVDYPLSDVGNLYGSATTGLLKTSDFSGTDTEYTAFKDFGAKVGLKFKITDFFSIRTEIDYYLETKSTVFSLKFGYNF